MLQEFTAQIFVCHVDVYNSNQSPRYFNIRCLLSKRGRQVFCFRAIQLQSNEGKFFHQHFNMRWSAGRRFVNLVSSSSPKPSFVNFPFHFRIACSNTALKRSGLRTSPCCTSRWMENFFGTRHCASVILVHVHQPVQISILDTLCS